MWVRIPPGAPPIRNLFDMSYFSNEKTVKRTRKPHRCEGCSTRILPHSQALVSIGYDRGTFWSNYYHPECREAELEWAKLHDIRDGDEWYFLYDGIEWEDWPWLLDKFPTVATQLGVTHERYERIKAEREATHRAFSELARQQEADRNLRRLSQVPATD